MSTYILTLAYDGTGYYGWQIQPDCLSITQVLVRTFSRVFNRSIKITGASRTDAGVHALGQVASFETDLELDPHKMQRAWNSVLPAALLIRKIEKVQVPFNPRAGVSQKTYYYHFFTKRPLPFAAPYGFFVRTQIDFEKFAACLALFQGTHDFRSFCTGYEKEITVRTIHSISCAYVPQFRCYRVTVKGPGFLKYMLRRIIGACLEVAGSTDLSVADLVAALEEKNPVQNFAKAPAHGLMLAAVRYSCID